MSVNNATGGDNSSPNFDSPNITGAIEEAQEKKNTEIEARRKEETVKIDGTPIDEKDQQFRTKDILKKKKTEFFVNVEGAEERAKAEKEAAEQAKAKAAANLDIEAEENYKKSVREKERQKKEFLGKQKALQRKDMKERLIIEMWVGHRKKKTLTIAFLILAVLGLSVYMLGFYIPARIAREKEEREIQIGIDLLNSLNAAREYYINGDVKAGNEAIDRLISEYDDPNRKADCYMFRADMLSKLGEGYAADAIMDAKKADEYASTYDTALLVYQLGTKFQRQDIVDEYYKILEERAEGQSNNIDDDKSGEG